MFHYLILALTSHEEIRHQLIILSILNIIYGQFLLFLFILCIGSEIPNQGEMYRLSKGCFDYTPLLECVFITNS